METAVSSWVVVVEDQVSKESNDCRDERTCTLTYEMDCRDTVRQ